MTGFRPFLQRFERRMLNVELQQNVGTVSDSAATWTNWNSPQKGLSFIWLLRARRFPLAC